MTARKIIIDTDPGQDDAVAILLALASPEDMTVLGITAVAGNVPLALTQKMRALCASWLESLRSKSLRAAIVLCSGPL